MKKWLVNYYTRKDTRWGFWKEDLKLNLIGVGITLAFCAGCKMVLDWKDKRETEKSIKEAIEGNEELVKYINEED